ncbi:MAG: MHYT domain-containing protein [Rhizomicrobium sp.]
MFHVIGCITQQHDLRLVALAGILCALACFTALSMVTRARAAAGRLRVYWIAGAGTVAGAGIWGTHFVAMLAYRAGLPVGYEPGLTLLSVVIAIVVCTAGFSIALSRLGPILGGAITGAAISAMHYAGMASVRIPADAVWNLGYVTASVVIGIFASMLALHIALKRNDFRAVAFGAGLFTLAIVGMHFTAMSAVTYFPDPAVPVPDAVLAPGFLAIAVAAVAFLIVTLGLIGAIVDHHAARRALSEAERLRAHIVELERTKKALEATSADLSRALGAASAASEAKSQFLAAMSHELRTPLNAVIGFCEILLMEAFGPLGSDRYVEYVRDIHSSGGHLLALINDILDISRLDAGQSVLDEEDLDLASVIGETLRMFARQAELSRVELVESLDIGLPQLRADRRRVRQVLINLLSNAIKFTPAGGRVRVSAALAQGEVCIVVADTGIGMDTADIPKALERFGQVDAKLSRKYEGAGLGLPLAKQIAELHGGRLELTSKVHVGTSVTIAFPCMRIVALDRVA